MMACSSQLPTDHLSGKKVSYLMVIFPHLEAILIPRFSVHWHIRVGGVWGRNRWSFPVLFPVPFRPGFGREKRSGDSCFMPFQAKHRLLAPEVHAGLDLHTRMPIFVTSSPHDIACHIREGHAVARPR